MFKYLAPLMLASLMLMGCQSTAHAPSLTAQQKQDRKKARALFEARFSYALKQAADLANTQGLSGGFNLVLTVNDKNEVVGCDTQPNKWVVPQHFPYNPRLAKQLTPICWTTVLPPMPAFFFDENSTTQQIVAPVLVYPLFGMTAENTALRAAKLQAHAQNDFMFKHLLATLPIDSIGIATLVLMTDNTGHVQECAANLSPHPLRPAAFKQDAPWLGALIRQCKQLNLNAMPGFSANPQSLTSVVKQIEYTPWKAGLKTTPAKCATAQSQNCPKTD